MSRFISLSSCVAVVALSCAPPPDLSQFADETAFKDVTTSAFEPDPVIGGWSGMALFDYDNDGDIDIFVANLGTLPNHLYRNDGRGNFTEVSNPARVRFREDNSVGAGVGDFDNDGRLDLLIARQLDQGGVGQSLRYLKNVGPDADGQVRFADATEEVGLGNVDFAASIGVGDYDNDGLLDLYIGRYDFRDMGFELESYVRDTPNVLLRNTGIVEPGIPVFEDVTEEAGVAGTAISGLAPDTQDTLSRALTLAVYFTDVNQDGWLDLFSLQDVPGGVDLFINNGDGTFAPSQADLLNKRGGWMGIAGADYDRDGDIDYFLTNVGSNAQGPPVSSNHVTSSWRRPDGTPFLRLLQNDGAGTFIDAAPATTVERGALPPTNTQNGRGLAAYEFGFGCAWLDADNDGWMDLTWTGDIAQGSGLTRLDFHGVSRFLRNLGAGAFADETASRGLFNWARDLPLEYGHSEKGRALGAIDLNGDGFPDICRSSIKAEDAFQCLMNPATEAGHWIIVRLTGTQSNRFGIGARVDARAAGEIFVGEVLTTTSAFTAVHPQVHFGLGPVERIDSLTVHWPSGVTTQLDDVDVDQIITITEQ